MNPNGAPNKCKDEFGWYALTTNRKNRQGRFYYQVFLLGACHPGKLSELKPEFIMIVGTQRIVITAALRDGYMQKDSY